MYLRAMFWLAVIALLSTSGAGCNTHSKCMEWKTGYYILNNQLRSYQMCVRWECVLGYSEALDGKCIPDDELDEYNNKLRAKRQK